MNEFDLIKQFCSHQTIKRPDVIVETGDDCAIVKVPPHHQLAITVDTLIAEIHFPLHTLAFDIGYKALAVNLSDLAAMGATPTWVTFALTLANIDKNFVNELARGFYSLANQYNVQLIGGDLTHGHLSMTLQAQGIIPDGLAITRGGAKVNDRIYVSNTLGDAGLALAFLKNEIAIPEKFQATLLSRLNRPEPRIRLGEKLRGIANSAIDISDGLANDLNHILKKSGVGAILYVDQLPLSTEMTSCVDSEKAISLALSAGDDYELCFTVSEKNETLLQDALKNVGCTYTCIGMITDSTMLDLHYQNGRKFNGTSQGYQHF